MQEYTYNNNYNHFITHKSSFPPPPLPDVKWKIYWTPCYTQKFMADRHLTSCSRTDKSPQGKRRRPDTGDQGVGRHSVGKSVRPCRPVGKKCTKLIHTKDDFQNRLLSFWGFSGICLKESFEHSSPSLRISFAAGKLSPWLIWRTLEHICSISVQG